MYTESILEKLILTFIGHSIKIKAQKKKHFIF